MSRTKYVKFGARADKNLFDLPSPKQALNNILDNISVQVDEDGNTLRFSADDLAPIIGISQGPLGNRLTPEGQSVEFVELASTTVEGTLTGQDSTTVPVEPRVTIQDHINNAKVSLGDPPWIDGGSGPDATIISLDRLSQYADGAYPESEVTADNVKAGNYYRILRGAGSPTWSEFQEGFYYLDGDYADGANPSVDDPTKYTEELLYDYSDYTGPRNGRSIAATGVTNSIVDGRAYIIHTVGSGSWSDVSVFAEHLDSGSPTVGLPVIATNTTTLTGGSLVVPAQEMGNLVRGQSYTILSLGAFSENAWNEWVQCGAKGIPYVGMQFICTLDPADQPTVSGNAWATDNYSIGDRVFTSEDSDDGNWNVYAPTALSKLSVRTQTLPSGQGSETLDPDEIKSGEVFYSSKFDPANLEELKVNQDFWEDGDLRLSRGLHPTFKDTEGGVVWDGYQSGYFDFNYFINGHFTFEEDINEDDNWTLIKGVNSWRFQTMKPVKFYESDGTTVLEFLEPDDWKRVCGGHTLVLDGDEYQVAEAYRSYSSAYGEWIYFARLEGSVGREGRSYLEFFYNRANEELWATDIVLTPVAAGKRRKIRYSCWWYEPDGSQEQQMEFKQFEHDNRSGNTSLSYSHFYKDSGINDVYGRYTFPYFMKNHASPTNQRTNAKLTVDGSISSLLYVAKQDAEDIFPGTQASGVDYASYLRQAKATNSAGKLESDAASGTGSPFSDISKGDRLTFVNYDTNNPGWSGSNELWSYQLLEKTSINTGYVHESLNDASGPNVGLMTNIEMLTHKNEGMVGTYKATRTSDTQMTLTVSNSIDGSESEQLRDITEGDFIYFAGEFGLLSASYSGSRYSFFNNKPYVVKKIDVSLGGGGQELSATCEIFPHASLSADRDVLKTSTAHYSEHGIAVIYASRGLNDLTGVHECKGVFGVEVASDNLLSDGNSNNELTLTNTNYDRIAIGDRVFFESAIPQATQPGLIGLGTKIASKPAGNKIALENENGVSVDITGDVNAGATLVIVPSSSYGGSTTELKKNREYCVIPLNTAPPFSSYTEGLQTTDTFPNLELKELAFKKLTYNSIGDHIWTNSTYSSGNLVSNLPMISEGFLAGDFVKIDGTQSTGVGRMPNIHYSGRIYRVLAPAGLVGGIYLNCLLEYWDGNSWENLANAPGGVNGLLEGLTFTRLGSALSLEDIQFEEGSSGSSNRGSESRTEAKEPDSYMEISYTPTGGTARNFRIFSNTRTIITDD